MKSTSPAGQVRPDPAAVGATGDTPQAQSELLAKLERASAEAAEAAGGWNDVWLDLAGQPVRLRFAGPAMAEPLLPALAHLRRDAAEEAAFTAHLWDSASTSTEPLRPAWPLEDYREHGVIRGFFGDGFYAVYLWGLRALNVVDTRHARGYFWMGDAARLGLAERGAPLRTLFHLWLTGRDLQLVHAASIGHEEGCLMIIGPSGAGKTSTALSCLDSDLRHLGEDYCLLRGGEDPRIFSIYSSAKIVPSVLDRMPQLRDLVASMPLTERDDKALLDLHAGRPERMLRSAPLRAIALPTIVEGPETRAERCSAGEALVAIAPSTLLQLPGNGEPLMRLLSQAIRSVPCYRLEVGDDPERIPPAIESLLAPA
jgi:hypothetical protein